MSVQAMGWAIDHSQHKGASLLVLIMIGNHAKSDGSGAWPSTELIAKECRMSERQVRRIIDTVLEPSGELLVKRRTGRPHLYDMPLVRTPDKLSDLSDAQKDDDPGQSVTPTPDISAPTPDIAMSDEPSVEPKASEDLKQDLAPMARNVRSPDPIWDTLVAIFGAAPRNPNLRGAWNVAAKELRDQGATPEEMGMRFALYRADMPNAACTPTALAKHWGRYAEGTPATRPVSKFDVGRARRRMRDGQTQGRGDRGVGGQSLGLGDGAGDVRALE